MDQEGGNGYFTWRRYDSVAQQVQAQTRSAAELGEVQTLSGGTQRADTPRVAMRDTYPSFGTGVFAWYFGLTGGPPYGVQTRSYSATNSLTDVQTLFSSQEEAVRHPGLAVNAVGTEVFVWRRDDGGNTLIQARVRSADDDLSEILTLSEPGQKADDPQVAVGIVVFYYLAPQRWRAL